MLKEVKAEYSLKVYSDGSILLKRIIEKDYYKLLKECSKRIQQSIEVVLKMKELRDIELLNGNQIEYAILYNTALGEVATNLSINVTTVRDKLERKLQLGADQVQSLIMGFLENGDLKFKQVLLESIINTKTQEQDQLAIDNLIKS